MNMSAKFSMIRAETLVIVILFSVKIKSFAFSTNVAEFENAKTLCSSDYQVAGKDLFNSCQPKNCGKIDLKGHEINNSMVDDTTQIVWINAYVVRSPVIEYKGCYTVNVPTETIHKLDHHQNDMDNDVLKCSRFCKSKGYAQRGYVVLLQGNKCYCAGKLFVEWRSKGQVGEVSTYECSKDCPGDEIDRCGGKKNQIVAAYKFKGDKNGEADTHLGNKCFYTAPNRGAPSTLISGNCFQKLKFRCQTVDISGGSKNVLTKRCYSILFNWYDAQQKCLQEKSYLPTYTPSTDICITEDVDEENNWHNAFVKERIVWETEPTNHLNAQQGTTNQDDTAEITTVSSVLRFSKQEDTKTTPSIPADAVIFGSVGGVTGLLFVVALVIVFIKRSSILKMIQESTQQSNSPLYENDIGLQQQVYQDLNPFREDINSPYDVMHTNNSPLHDHDIGLENQVYQDLTPDREDNNTPYDELHIKNTL